MKLNVNGSVSGKYFVPHNDGVVLKATWANASRHCKKHGSRLTSITSATESKAIQKFISKPKFADDNFWIGLHDKKKEGHFKWSDGQNVTFTNWGYGEPNGGKRENCAEITKKVPRVWNDASCGNKTAFICEKRQQRQMTGNPTGQNKDLTTIIGASVGGAVFIALVVLLIIFCTRKRQKRHSKQNVKGKMHSAGENNLMDVYDDVVTKNQSMEMKDQNIKTDVHSKKEAELSPYIELGPQDEPNLYEDLKDVTPEIPRRSSKKGADIGGEKETLVVEDTPKHDYENGDKLDANDGDYLQAITHNETDDGSYVDHYVHIVP